MAKEDIFFKLELDTSSSVQNLTKLKSEIIKDEQALKALRKEINKQGGATTGQAKKLVQLETRVKGLRGAYREATNAASGLTKEGLRFRDKIAGALTDSLKRVGFAVAGAFAVTRIVDFSKELLNTAQELKGIEFAFERLGDRGVDAFERIKVSTRGLISDADIKTALVDFDNFNISLEETDTLFEFLAVRAAQTGKSIDSLRDSLVEGLSKESKLRIDNLGISAQALNEELEKTPNFVQAVANIAKTEVAEAGDILDDAANSTEKWNVIIENTKNALAIGLTPIIDSLFDTVISLEKATKSSADQFFSLQQSTERLEQGLTPLLNRYDELSAKTSLNAEEQEELDSIITDVSKTVPSAVTEFDKYGKALGINTDAAKAFIQEQKNILALTNQEAIKEQLDAIKSLNIEIEAQNRGVKNLNGEWVRETQTISKNGQIRFQNIKITNDELKAIRLTTSAKQEEVKTREAIIARLRGEQTEAEKNIDLKKEDKETTDTITGSVRALNEEIKKLKEEQQDLTLLTPTRATQIKQEIASIEQQIKDILDPNIAQRDNTVFDAIQTKAIETGKVIGDQPKLELLDEDQLTKFNREFRDFIITQDEIRANSFEKQKQAIIDRTKFELEQEGLTMSQREIIRAEGNARIEDLERQRAIATIEQAQLVASTVSSLASAAFGENKELAVASATINGALAATKTFAQLGWPAGIIGAAAVIAQTAVQVSRIQQAEDGMLVPKYNNGGILKGPSHAQGGIPLLKGGSQIAEVEGGEAIINKRSTAMYKPVLSAINQAGGGKKFANGGLLGSTIPRVAPTISSNADIIRALNSINFTPTVSVVEINKANTNISEIADRGNL